MYECIWRTNSDDRKYFHIRLLFTHYRHSNDRKWISNKTQHIIFMCMRLIINFRIFSTKTLVLSKSWKRCEMVWREQPCKKLSFKAISKEMLKNLQSRPKFSNKKLVGWYFYLILWMECVQNNNFDKSKHSSTH